jgi:hypothetical protein
VHSIKATATISMPDMYRQSGFASLTVLCSSEIVGVSVHLATGLERWRKNLLVYADNAGRYVHCVC